MSAIINIINRPFVYINNFYKLNNYSSYIKSGKFDLNGVEIKIESQDTLQAIAYCHNTGEENTGINKICYYDCLGNRSAITIKSYQLCPISIDSDNIIYKDEYEY